MTHWRIHAPLKAVWDELFDSERWPDWWRGLESVVELKQGDAHRVGSVHRFTWRGRLPYRLMVDMQTIRVSPLIAIESLASGELEGRGLWQLSGDEQGTAVRYDWEVRTTKRWMNLMSPIARPLFIWNHHVVMRWGEEGLKRLLERSAGMSAAPEREPGDTEAAVR